MTTRAELCPWIGKSVEDSPEAYDNCPRCGYGPLQPNRRPRRKRCPACFMVLPWPEPEKVR